MNTTITKPPRVTVRQRQQAARILKRRKKVGITRTQLAEQAGISIGMLRKLEIGQVPERSVALPAVLNALNVAEQDQP